MSAPHRSPPAAPAVRARGTVPRWVLVVALCAGVSIAGSLGALPVAAHWIAKPLTTALIVLATWDRGRDVPGRRRAVLAGLALSWIGDVCLLWPRQGFLPGLVAFLLAHLAYVVAFTRPVRFGVRWMPFVVYGVIAALALGRLWPGVPEPLRIPVLAYVACLATMAAQAAAWARAIPSSAAGRCAAAGGALFLLSDTLLAFDRFDAPLPAAPLWILSSYWAAQVLIALSLPAGRDRDPPGRPSRVPRA